MKTIRITTEKNILFIFTGLLVFMSSCTPKISTTIFRYYESSDEHADVTILGTEDGPLENPELIGSLQIDSRGSSRIDCAPDILLEKAKVEVRKTGGNALKIQHYTLNSNGCPNLEADIIKITNPEKYLPAGIPSDANYALLHIYRSSGQGFAVNYDLHLDSTVIARSANNWRETVKIEKAGEHTLWARTETKTEIPIHITFGNEYYIRSGVTVGAFIGRPYLGYVDNTIGRLEFQSIKANPRYSITSDTVNPTKNFNYRRFRFAFSGGWSFRTADVPEGASSEQTAHIEQLKSGFHGDLTLTHFFSEWGGLGLKYNASFAKATTDALITWNGTTLYGKIVDKTRIQFIGPFFSYRLLDRKKQNSFLLDWGVGYLGYKDQGSTVLGSSTMKGVTVGTYMNIGYDIGLSNAVSLGFQLSLIGGRLSEYTLKSPGVPQQVISLKEGEYEGLGRIDLSVGLRF